MSTLALPGFAEGDPVAELWDRHCRSRQPESKATCAVLEAVADILQQEGIAPSPTAVFAATMSSLERADASIPAEQTGAMLTVLATALEHAPPAPVLSRLPATAKVLMSAGRAARSPHPRFAGWCAASACSWRRCARRRRRRRSSRTGSTAPSPSPLSATCASTGGPRCASKRRRRLARRFARSEKRPRQTPPAAPSRRSRSSPCARPARPRASSRNAAPRAQAAEQRARAAAAESPFLGALKRILVSSASPPPAVAAAVVGLLDLCPCSRSTHATRSSRSRRRARRRPRRAQTPPRSPPRRFRLGARPPTTRPPAAAATTARRRSRHRRRRRRGGAPPDARRLA